jgi:hypothetical protein
MKKPLRMLPLSICVILVNAAMAAFCGPSGEGGAGDGRREGTARLRALADLCAAPAGSAPGGSGRRGDSSA